jgi:hypothetical protein
MDNNTFRITFALAIDELTEKYYVTDYNIHDSIKYIKKSIHTFKNHVVFG